MKKRTRGILVQFLVNKAEEEEIRATMERNGISNRSDFMRIIALSKPQISFSTKFPSILRVSEATFEAPEEVRQKKRAVG